jgi:hypothetical protein
MRTTNPSIYIKNQTRMTLTWKEIEPSSRVSGSRVNKNLRKRKLERRLLLRKSEGLPISSYLTGCRVANARNRNHTITSQITAMANKGKKSIVISAESISPPLTPELSGAGGVRLGRMVMPPTPHITFRIQDLRFQPQRTMPIHSLLAPA